MPSPAVPAIRGSGLAALVAALLVTEAIVLSGWRKQQQFDRDNRAQELALLSVATEASLFAFCIAGLFHPVAYHFYFYYTAGFVIALKGIAERMTAAEEGNTTAVVHPAVRGLPQWNAR